MDEKTQATLNTIYKVLAVPAVLLGLWGSYYVFTYKPAPKVPEPKIETFRAEQREDPNAAKPKKGEPKIWHIELVWDVSNSTDITIDQGIGKVDPAGKRAVDLEKSTTYVMKAKNESGEVTYNLDVDIPAADK